MREIDANTRAVSIIGETMMMRHPGQPTYFELAAVAVRNLAEAGFEIVPTARKDDRKPMAFEDIDCSPPAAAGHADHLLATWVRALGYAVDWCEMRLLPRRLVLNVSLCGRVPSDEQLKDLDHRLGIIRSLRGVVGADRTIHGSPGVTVQVRFDYYITTIGCEYTPLDLPARPVRSAA